MKFRVTVAGIKTTKIIMINCTRIRQKIIAAEIPHFLKEF